MDGLSVAVVGVTGAVGQELLLVLEQRRFPVSRLVPLASERSEGRRVSFAGRELVVARATPEAFDGVDLAFFSAGAGTSVRLVPEACARGAVVVDNSSAFRLSPDVPLVVPEVNPDALAGHGGVIANPNCATIVMLMAFKPVDDLARVTSVVVSTYQAVSGAGARAMAALLAETRACLDGAAVEPSVLPFASAARHYQIAFNLIPQVDVFEEEGYTKEEWKMVRETRKIVGREVPITATCVRVPVLRCHSESLYLETERSIGVEEVRDALRRAPGVVVVDDPASQSYPMPIDVSGQDPVYVGRIRPGLGDRPAVSMWVVGDQVRKGAALNAVQIAERLIDMPRMGRRPG